MADFAEIVLQSNCIFTAVSSKPFAGYVAVAGGQLLAVGEGLCPVSFINSQTQVLELGNRTVSPGFSDVHCFFTGYSMGFVGADLTTAASCEEAVGLAKAHASLIPVDRPVLGHGWDNATLPLETGLWYFLPRAVRPAG